MLLVILDGSHYQNSQKWLPSLTHRVNIKSSKADNILALKIDPNGVLLYCNSLCYGSHFFLIMAAIQDDQQHGTVED